MTKSTVDYAIDILEEMIKVLRGREICYGDIRDNSAIFDSLMKSLGVKKPEGVNSVDFLSYMNIASKLSRISNGDRLHEDNYIDGANYLLLIAAHNRRLKTEKNVEDIEWKDIKTAPRKDCKKICALMHNGDILGLYYCSINHKWMLYFAPLGYDNSKLILTEDFIIGWCPYAYSLLKKGEVK